MNNYYTINSIVKELKFDYHKLSDYELLTIDIQKQWNEIIVSELNINQENKYPSAPEDIEFQLVFKNISVISLADLLKEITEKRYRFKV